MTSPFFPPRRIVKAKRRLTATVRPLPMSDEDTTDVVRPPDSPRFYAFIEEVEVESMAGDGHRYDILLLCHSADWFDKLAEDLSDLPALNTVAGAAQMCAVRMITTTDSLASLSATLEKVDADFDVSLETVHLAPGWWLEAVFDNDPANGVPVAVFLPARGSNDPTTIGHTNHQVAAALVSLTRIRPPRRLIKLQRFLNVAGR